MIRTLLLDKREGQDKKTNDPLLFLTLYKLPTKMKDGGLWHPKQEEALLKIVINSKYKPVDYEDLNSDDVNPGCLVDVTYGFNESSGKGYVSKVEVVPGTNHKPEDLYL